MTSMLGYTNTSGRQLNTVGKTLFGAQWLGVYPVDKLPKTIHSSSTSNRYMIINTDISSGPGIHWVAVIVNKKTLIVWDSYARPSKRIIPKFLKNVAHRYKTMDAQLDKKTNQHKRSQICGQLSLAWMQYAKKNGIAKAMQI